MSFVGIDGVELASVRNVEVSSDRVVLRELLAADAEALVRVFGDAEVVRYLTLPMQTLDSEFAFLAKANAEARRVPRREYQLAITVGEVPEAVGTCRIGIESIDQRTATIGYAMRRDLWGKGLGTELVCLLAQFGFETLRVHRIWATHHPENPASGRVLTKAGFHLEGTIRDHMFVKGRWRDAVAYSLLESDWNRRIPDDAGEP